MNPSTDTEFFHDAVNHWWASKRASQKKKGKKRAQGGTRDDNLAGKTMDGFASALTEYLVRLGVNREHIFTGGQFAKRPALLPSFFRASKNWDLVVIANSHFHSAKGDTGNPMLYVAIEFKSQDKSIGNNQNNRLEESIGNAHDFWKTYEQTGFYCLQPRPFLGYLFVGHYATGSDDVPVEIRQPHFLAQPPFRRTGSDALPKFSGPSYAERYQLFLRQAISSRLYDAATFIVTEEAISTGTLNHRILFSEFGPSGFLRQLKAHILAHYPAP